MKTSITFEIHIISFQFHQSIRINNLLNKKHIIELLHLMSLSPPSKKQKTDIEPQEKKPTMSIKTLKVKFLSENATLPARGSTGAAGYDLFR